ncbi:hypothetical protein ABD91_25825 [Lysinibacillus sphaericus]|uniref:hypothetical protein n=1 Tax=Lysinibacillus sphaericus TaxID=1421 RepID=UPI0018CF235B|nr:hypothetical protein [Lysinibacillus sphaericus]MBG9694156.1 hypothetical protein [Lysinibacillus sphaericus]
MCSKLIYNEDKTNELVEEMRKKGYIASVQDLSVMIRNSGILVRETIGRKRSYIEVSPEMYGVDIKKKQEGTRKFFEDHVRKGRLSFIPSYFDRKLTNLEGKVRIARRRATIGYDEKFMTMESYNEFQKKFEDWKQEYYKIRDEIINNWDQIILDFRESLESSLSDLNSINHDVMIDKIMNKIADRENYYNSFYMNLVLEAFPIADNLAMFTPEIQNQMRKNVEKESIRAMYEMLQSNIDVIFVQTARIINTLDSGQDVHHRTINQMSIVANQVRKNNIIGNDVIFALAEICDQIGKRGIDRYAIKELHFYCILYAEELGLVNELTWVESPYTLKEAQEKIEVLKVDFAKFKNSARTKEVNVKEAEMKAEYGKKAELQEGVETVITLAYEDMSLAIKNLFNVVNKIIYADIKKEVYIDENYVQIISDISNGLLAKNVINDPFIEKVIVLTRDIIKLDSKKVGEMAEKAEMLLSYIYYAAKERGIHKNLDLSESPYTDTVLEEMALFYYK